MCKLLILSFCFRHFCFVWSVGRSLVFILVCLLLFVMLGISFCCFFFIFHINLLDRTTELKYYDAYTASGMESRKADNSPPNTKCDDGKQFHEIFNYKIVEIKYKTLFAWILHEVYGKQRRKTKILTHTRSVYHDKKLNDKIISL